MRLDFKICRKPGSTRSEISTTRGITSDWMAPFITWQYIRPQSGTVRHQSQIPIAARRQESSSTHSTTEKYWEHCRTDFLAVFGHFVSATAYRYTAPPHKSQTVWAQSNGPPRFHLSIRRFQSPCRSTVSAQLNYTFIKKRLQKRIKQTMVQGAVMFSRILAAASVSAFLISPVTAFSTFAGGCVGGAAAIDPVSHGFGGTTGKTGEIEALSSRGTTFTINGVEISGGETFPVGTDLDFFLETTDAYGMRGILVRVESSGSTYTLEGTTGLFPSSLCAGDNVQGVTHNDALPKTTAAGSMRFDAAGSVEVDVTIVYRNFVVAPDNVSINGYDRFTLNIQAEPATVAPTPVDPPPVAPTPVESPVVAPVPVVESPVDAPVPVVESPVVAPVPVVETPVVAPVLVATPIPVPPLAPVPVVVATDLPAEASSDSPSSAPSSVPTSCGKGKKKKKKKGKGKGKGKKSKEYEYVCDGKGKGKKAGKGDAKGKGGKGGKGDSDGKGGKGGDGKGKGSSDGKGKGGEGKGKVDWAGKEGKDEERKNVRYSR